jgi:hypothetical protein
MKKKDDLEVLVDGGDNIITLDLSEEALLKFMDKRNIIDRNEGKALLKEEIEMLIDIANDFESPKILRQMLVEIVNIKKGDL